MPPVAPLKTWSGDVVIDTLKKFAEFAIEMSNVDFLFLSEEQLLKEPEEVAKAAPIPKTSLKRSSR